MGRGTLSPIILVQILRGWIGRRPRGGSAPCGWSWARPCRSVRRPGLKPRPTHPPAAS